MLLGKLLGVEPAVVWGLQALAGMELGTGWGYSSREALAVLGGAGQFVTVVKGLVTAVKG